MSLLKRFPCVSINLILTNPTRFRSLISNLKWALLGLGLELIDEEFVFPQLIKTTSSIFLNHRYPLDLVYNSCQTIKALNQDNYIELKHCYFLKHFLDV